MEKSKSLVDMNRALFLGLMVSVFTMSLVLQLTVAALIGTIESATFNSLAVFALVGIYWRMGDSNRLLQEARAEIQRLNGQIPLPERAQTR